MSYKLFLDLVEHRPEVVHVRFVERLVAVERAVGLDEVENRDVTIAVGRAELLRAVLEYRYDDLELVDEHADVVLLDVAADGDGDARDSGGFIFLHDSLHFGEVLLAVRALGAEVVDDQGTLGKVAEQDARIAHASEREAEVHLHGGASGILHERDVCRLRFGGKLSTGHCRGNSQKREKTCCKAHNKKLLGGEPVLFGFHAL